MIPALCALLGLCLTVAACGASSASTAAGSHPVSPGHVGGHHRNDNGVGVGSHSAVSVPSVDQPSLVRGPVPRVLADCVSAPPHRLSVRPASIALACADNGWGVENMAWTSWTTSGATGQGTFWEKLCQPNCAAGKIGTYPVAVTLTAVKTSSQGQWFSRLTVTWKATPPPNPTPASFPLMPPQY